MEMMTIKEIAQLSGVTIRTLQYYDKIGLLSPDDVTDAGYRQYSLGNLVKLQRILIYKELGFSLKEIKKGFFDGIEEVELNQQREMLMMKKEKLERMIDLADQIIKGEKNLDFEVFKKTLISGISNEIPIEDSNILKELITPELHENINELYGENEFFQLDIPSEESLLNSINQATEYLRMAILEQDEEKACLMIKNWLDSVSIGFQMKNVGNLPEMMIKDYSSNEIVIRQAEATFGEGASQKIVTLLKKVYR